MHQRNSPWGQHLVLDLDGCPTPLLGDVSNLRVWLSALVDAIGMKAYGEPSIDHFATHYYVAAGYIVLQLIETSNICAHFAENLSRAYIDNFSCKVFDGAIAEKIGRQYFEPQNVFSTSLDRGVFPHARAQVA